MIAVASRGARLFIKKALQQGHSVTTLFRAKDDAAALVRMQELLVKTKLTEDGITLADIPGNLRA